MTPFSLSDINLMVAKAREDVETALAGLALALVQPIGVPVLGGAPDVYVHNGLWIILCPLPRENGLTASNCEIRFENAGVSLDRKFQIGRAGTFIFPQLAVDADITYRWRNNYRDSSDGWSGYSASTVAYGSASASVNTPFENATGFENDTSDGNLL